MTNTAVPDLIQRSPGIDSVELDLNSEVMLRVLVQELLNDPVTKEQILDTVLGTIEYNMECITDALADAIKAEARVMLTNAFQNAAKSTALAGTGEEGQ